MDQNDVDLRVNVSTTRARGMYPKHSHLLVSNSQVNHKDIRHCLFYQVFYKSSQSMHICQKHRKQIQQEACNKPKNKKIFVI